MVSGVDYMESSRRVSARRMAEEDDSRGAEEGRPPIQDVQEIRRSVGNSTNDSASDASNNLPTPSSIEFRARMTPP